MCLGKRCVWLAGLVVVVLDQLVQLARLVVVVVAVFGAWACLLLFLLL